MSTTIDDLVKQYQAQWATAHANGDTAGEIAAHNGAEAARATAGYSGGADGSQYIPYSDNTISSGLTSANSQSNYINQLYAAKKATAVAGLKSAYEQNVADLDNTAAQIPAAYNTARNNTAATSAINQAAFNERAASSGLNNGAGGQASLSMANTLSSNLSSLDSSQASKLADLYTQRAKLTAAYNNAIQQAASENDATRAQSLYNEAVRVDNSLVSTAQAQASLDYQKQQAQTSQNEYSDEKALNYAKLLASYGNFTQLQKLLGLSDDETAYLQKVWAANNA